jgi:hypothetical protein
MIAILTSGFLLDIIVNVVHQKSLNRKIIFSLMVFSIFSVVADWVLFADAQLVPDWIKNTAK